MWELFTLGQTPYENIVELEGIGAWLAEGKRLETPVFMPKSTAAIMASCWEARPELRPTFRYNTCQTKSKTKVTNLNLHTFKHVQDNRRHYEAGKKDGHHATQALQRGHNRLRDLSVAFAGGQLRSNDWLEVNIELLWFSLLVKPY